MRAHENPFRTARLESLAFRPRRGSLADVLERWERLDRRGVIAGPHGTGKTTLLRALGEALRETGRTVVCWRFCEASPTPPLRQLLADARRLEAHEVLCLDGSERLSRWSLRRVMRAARSAHGVLLTAHAPRGGPLLYETRRDRELLRELTSELLGPGNEAPVALLDPLFEARDGNLREVFLDLYDRMAHDDPAWRAAAGPLPGP